MDRSHNYLGVFVRSDKHEIFPRMHADSWNEVKKIFVAVGCSTDELATWSFNLSVLEAFSLNRFWTKMVLLHPKSAEVKKSSLKARYLVGIWWRNGLVAQPVFHKNFSAKTFFSLPVFSFLSFSLWFLLLRHHSLFSSLMVLFWFYLYQTKTPKPSPQRLGWNPGITATFWVIGWL